MNNRPSEYDQEDGHRRDEKAWSEWHAVNYPSTRVRALQDAVDGELDGLGISDSVATEILRHLDVAERAVAFRMRGPSSGAWQLTDDFGLAGDLLGRGWEVQPLAPLLYISDKRVERIAGCDELTGDAILRFARDLLAVASGSKP